MYLSSAYSCTLIGINVNVPVSEYLLWLFISRDTKKEQKKNVFGTFKVSYCIHKCLNENFHCRAMSFYNVINNVCIPNKSQYLNKSAIHFLTYYELLLPSITTFTRNREQNSPFFLKIWHSTIISQSGYWSSSRADLNYILMAMTHEKYRYRFDR